MTQDVQELRQELAVMRDVLQEVKLDAVRAHGKVEALRAAIAEIDRELGKLENSKVSVVAFNPVQKLIYGLVGSILFAFLAALIGLVVIPQDRRTVGEYGIKPSEIEIHATPTKQRK